MMPKKDAARFAVTYLQILDEKGKVDTSLEPKLSDEQFLDLYHQMLFTRETDRRMLNLQRQGRIGTFPPVSGQEATMCGAALAMGETDWLVPSYRETGARFMRGDTLEHLLLYYNGYEEGAATPSSLRILPPQVILGSQTLHAVGIAYAIKMREEKDTAVVTFFGDGASSEGDVAEALNFAGVWKAPVVFICQNNGWAISTPRDQQTSSGTIAQKAIAYGFEGLQVDGNDPLAVYTATKEALEKAKAGGGPTLIEAITYRLMMHTTADDPKKYRKDAEVEKWQARDPLPRFRKYLEKKGLLNEDLHASMELGIKTDIDEAISRLEANINRKPDVNFDHVFADEHYTMADQRAEFLAELAKENDNG